MEEELIGIINLDTGIGSAGVGWVVVPSDIDRKQYVEDCYRTCTLTINGGKGYGYFSGVHASPEVMQNIEFPTDEANRGTPVIWVKDAISQLPVVVAYLRKQGDYYAMGEKQFRLSRGTEEKRNVEVFIDGNTSELQINVLGDSEFPANVNIKINSENEDSTFNLSCDNKITVASEKEITIDGNQVLNLLVTTEGKPKCALVYKSGEGLTYKDEFGNEFICKEGQVQLISEEILHNEGKEPMVLGDTLADILKDILEAIQKITVISPSGGTSVPVNAADFAAITGKLDTIKSKISKLD